MAFRYRACTHETDLGKQDANTDLDRTEGDSVQECATNHEAESKKHKVSRAGQQGQNLQSSPETCLRKLHGCYRFLLCV